MEIFGPHHPTISYQIDQMVDENRNPIEVVRHPLQIVRIPITQKLDPYDMIRIVKKQELTND